jgi:histidyl-tRNA synthetase
MFRRERPQRGRYRQFHQIGAEALGFGGPEVDAELILLAVHLWAALGIRNWRLELNCLGQPDERRAHRAALIAYFEAHAEQLDEDARRRLHSNPLRILDTKNPAMQALVEGAPRCWTIWARPRAPTSRPCRPSCAPPACRIRSTRAWCAGWTTTT